MEPTLPSPPGERLVIRHIDDGENTYELEELIGTHRKIMRNKSRMQLIRSLLSKGLCTRDIYSFVCIQTDLCEVNTTLDRDTITSAMQAKIRDIKEALGVHYKVKKRQEDELLRKLDGNSNKWRRKLRAIRKIIKQEKQEIEKDYKKKIEHYKESQNRYVEASKVKDNGTGTTGGTTITPTIPPKHLAEYASLSVFGLPGDFKKKQKPLGPFITSKSIKLSKGERRLLSKDPKYSLKINPSQMEMSIETERMNCKARYDLGNKRLDGIYNKNCRITTEQGTPIDWSRQCILNNKGLPPDEDILLKLFEGVKNSHVYNPLDRTIKFSDRRATDYKLNKSVILPGPLDSNQEFQCELRRQFYMKALDQYSADYTAQKNKENEKLSIRKQRNHKKENSTGDYLYKDVVVNTGLSSDDSIKNIEGGSNIN